MAQINIFFVSSFSLLEVKMKRLKISQRFKNSPEQNEEIMNRTYTGRIVISFPLGVNRRRYKQEKDYQFTFEKPNRTELNTIHSQRQKIYIVKINRFCLLQTLS